MRRGTGPGASRGGASARPGPVETVCRHVGEQAACNLKVATGLLKLDVVDGQIALKTWSAKPAESNLHCGASGKLSEEDISRLPPIALVARSLPKLHAVHKDLQLAHGGPVHVVLESQDRWPIKRQ